MDRQEAGPCQSSGRILERGPRGKQGAQMKPPEIPTSCRRSMLAVRNQDPSGHLQGGTPSRYADRPAPFRDDPRGRLPPRQPVDFDDPYNEAPQSPRVRSEGVRAPNGGRENGAPAKPEKFRFETQLDPGKGSATTTRDSGRRCRRRQQLVAGRWIACFLDRSEKK